MASEADRHTTKVQARSLLRGARLARRHTLEGEPEKAMATLDSMIATAEGHIKTRQRLRREYLCETEWQQHRDGGFPDLPEGEGHQHQKAGPDAPWWPGARCSGKATRT